MKKDFFNIFKFREFYRKRAIRWKLIIGYLTIAIIAAGALGITAFSLIKSNINRQKALYIESVAKMVAINVKDYISQKRNVEMQKVVETMGMMGNIHIKILASDKEVLADSRKKVHPLIEPQVSGLTLNISIAGQFFDAVIDSLVQMTNPTEEDMKQAPIGNIEAIRSDDGNYYLAPLIGDRGVLGYVELGEGLDFSKSALPARNALLLAGLFAAFLSGLLGLVMGNRIAKPISQLTRDVGEIREDNLHIRSEIKRDDEIGLLSRQFNLMAGRLEKSFTQLEKERDILKHFAADASHELRTPVTALTTFNELLSGPLGDDPESRIEFLNDSRTQISRMEWIIKNLLELSRYDGSLIELKPEFCSISDIVDTALSSVISGIKEKNIRINKQFEETSFRCDKQRVVQALVNLLANAIKFSDSEGEITVRVDKEQSSRALLRFSVLDNGPGIPNDDVFNIFKRFYRAAPEKVPGSGLGLSLVESIAKAHGGAVRARNITGGGADVSFVVPEIL